jgi:hypothetical protein
MVVATYIINEVTVTWRDTGGRKRKLKHCDVCGSATTGRASLNGGAEFPAHMLCAMKKCESAARDQSLAPTRSAA